MKNKKYEIELLDCVLRAEKTSAGFIRELMVRDGEDCPDKKSVEFHLDSGDYFGTLATVLDLLRQQHFQNDEQISASLKNLKEDLMYLQRNYTIIKKDSLGGEND